MAMMGERTRIERRKWGLGSVQANSIELSDERGE